MEKAKVFDCVEMKRKGAAVVLARLESMTREEQLAFWHAEHLKLQERKRRLAQELENREAEPVK